MKACPKCGRTYSDDTWDFCLDDGAVLVGQNLAGEPTVLINQTRDTVPRPSAPVTVPVPSQSGWNVQATSGSGKKGSKMWLVALMILGGLIIACGGGAAGLIFIASRADDGNRNISDSDNKKKVVTTANNEPGSNSRSGVRSEETKIDLSGWGTNTREFGTTEFADGELRMKAKAKGYYYVLIARQSDGTSVKADTTVKIRNVDGVATNVGYGLVFHSAPTPLDKGYAFLIDSVGKRFRVAYHLSKKENVLVDWTKTDAVNTGTAENVLEVRDLENKIELYINGTMVTSIRNVYGHPAGVPGVYSGDGLNAGFSDLTIKK